jgi:hypothetical protein
MKLISLLSLLSIVGLLSISAPASASTKYNGWIDGVTATATTGQQFTAIQNYWTVPSFPSTKSDGQTVTLWNGLETATHFSLYPTLVWGTLATNGGSIGNYTSWQIAPVEVNESGTVYAGAPTNVSVGDTIEGIVEYVGQVNGLEEWTCEIRDYTKNSSWVSLTAEVANSEDWIYAFGATLGADVNSDPADLPGTGGGCNGTNYWSESYVLNQNGSQVTPNWVFDEIGSPGFTFNGPNCSGFFSKVSGSDWELGM